MKTCGIMTSLTRGVDLIASRKLEAIFSRSMETKINKGENNGNTGYWIRKRFGR